MSHLYILLNVVSKSKRVSLLWRYRCG